MRARPLGRSGLQVSPLAVGCNVFGWTIDEATSFRVLDACLERGLVFLDTADVYSRWAPGHVGGESEAIIGRWMAERGCRDRVILATKVGMDMGDGRVGLKPARIEEAVHASLKRLGTDRIDLYQAHKDDEETPQAETLAAFGRLVAAGKVRAIGASNFEAARLREALDLAEDGTLPRYESLQPQYNLYDRADYEGGLAAVAAEHGIGVIPYYGLAAGFLTGKYRSEADYGKSPRGARSIPRYMTERGMRILAALDEVAAAHGTEPAAVALAWLMTRPTITAPIASATSEAQVATLAAATALTLTPDEIARLDATGP